MIDTPETLAQEAAIEKEARAKAKRAESSYREREPERGIVSSWHRYYLKLEKLSMLAVWDKAFRELRMRATVQTICKHDDILQIRSSGNKYAKQVICEACKKNVIYEHTKY